MFIIKTMLNVDGYWQEHSNFTTYQTLRNNTLIAIIFQSLNTVFTAGKTAFRSL